MLTKTEQDRSVIKLWFTDASKEDIWFMLRSDAHHDSAHCRRDLEKRHLELAMEKGAYILDAGDLFDAMQGRNDKRFRADNIALDLRNGNLPPGLVLKDETGKIAMVCKNRYNLQEMKLP